MTTDRFRPETVVTTPTLPLRNCRATAGIPTMESTMRKSPMIIGVVSLALSLGLVKGKTATRSKPSPEPRFQLANLSGSKLGSNSGFCRKMDYYCLRGDQNACDTFDRLCVPKD